MAGRGEIVATVSVKDGFRAEAPAIPRLGELAAETAAVEFAHFAVVLDRAGQVLTAQDGERVTVIAQPFDHGQHQPVEQRRSDERRRGTRHEIFADFDNGIAWNAAVIQHVVSYFV